MKPKMRPVMLYVENEEMMQLNNRLLVTLLGPSTIISSIEGCNCVVFKCPKNATSFNP